MKSYSQSFQDLFALQNSKHNSYVEVGGESPVIANNTYLLEKAGWSGLTLEIDISWLRTWGISDRLGKNNKIRFVDALEYDFSTQAGHYGYLSIDIYGPTATFDALTRVIESGLSFDTITFEHDDYAYTNSVKDLVEEYLCERGYKVAVYDVYPERLRPEHINNESYYETWFVSENIEFDTCSFDSWKSAFSPEFYHFSQEEWKKYRR